MRLCPAELQQRYREGRLLPFVGAGISMSVEWDDHGITRRGISWSELVAEAGKKLGFQDPSLLRVRGTDLQILEYFRIKNKGHFASLNYWLKDVMGAPDSALQNAPIHQRLAKMTGCQIFYTTNFDDFLERSFQLNGRAVRVVATEHDMGKPATATEIVKFHGDLDNPDHMVLSEKHYEERLALATPMDYRFRSDLLGRAVLFIGYSFRDYNVSYLFRLINDHFGGLPLTPNGRRAYIVVEQPSDFELQLFSARNIEIIPVRRGALTSEISELLDELVS